MSYNLPNPSLLGILLIISTHTGPHLVFNYPENLSPDYVQKANKHNRNAYSDDDDEDEEDEKVSSPTSNDAEYRELQKSQDNGLRYDNDLNEWDTMNFNYYMGTKKDLILFLDDQEKSRKLKKVASNASGLIAEEPSSPTSKTIFGIEPAYLCEMLAPPKKMCNSRFELMIDDKVFLGLPIHVYDNGNWRLKKQNTFQQGLEKSKKKKKKTKENDDEDDEDDEEAPEEEPVNPQSNLTMFHLVFIMNPPTIEFNYRIEEMFMYVISRLSLVLRYEQLKNEYVSKQARIIVTLKEKYKNDPVELSKQLMEQSQLYKITLQCFQAISTSNIANVVINNKVRSFQIPIKTEFQSLPELSVPFIPGSHLSSTVNLLGTSGVSSVGEATRYGQSKTVEGDKNNDDLDDTTNVASDDLIHFALLLLDDPEEIIKDIKTEPTSTLANFIRTIKPTESLLKLSVRNNLQIVQFALHLIYWRRARVIQPLSTRSTYIILPMAPITLNLYRDIHVFRKTYPSLPSLAQFLKLLSPQSRKPQQFATIIPSRDHKDMYLEALSWLIRYGYVTQLQTFIWLKIPRKIKIKVDEDLENESLIKKKSNLSKKLNIGGTDNTSKMNECTDNTSKKVDAKKEDELLLVQQNSAAVASQTNANKPAPSKNGNSQVSTPNTLLSTIKLEEDDDNIVLDPGRATTLERRWINKIIFDECNLSSELINVFYKLLKYMNGKIPLELLLLKENISRTELRKLLVAIDEYTISVRHW